MSGVESASLVLSLISSIISIIDGAKQVYDAVSDTTGLPEAFREVALRIPIVEDTLEAVRKQIAEGHINETTVSLRGIVEACDDKSKKLRDLFEQVIPQAGASRIVRYRKAVRTLGKGGRVEALMKSILENVHLLASNRGLSTATEVQLAEVQAALDGLSQVSPSVPDEFFQQPSYTNTNYGPGPQNNFNAQNQHNNAGSGNFYHGTTQNFGKD